MQQGEGMGVQSVRWCNPVAFLAHGGFIPQGFTHAEVLTHPEDVTIPCYQTRPSSV
jgi:hypothetical protein